MSFRALVFDVYGTLLDLGPPPPTADADWERLFRETFHRAPSLNRAAFLSSCSEIIRRRHEWARARGILFPEVVWPSVLGEMLPEFRSLPPAARDDFVLKQIHLHHTTTLHPQAAFLLPRLREEGSLLGIASNGQAYTVDELREAFACQGLDWTQLFEPSLCFWSYEHGFSKPDPHVFQILTSRLEARGVPLEETLMIGDRLDNDIGPALQHGWKVWHLNDHPGQRAGGGWTALLETLGASLT